MIIEESNYICSLCLHNFVAAVRNSVYGFVVFTEKIMSVYPHISSVNLYGKLRDKFNFGLNQSNIRNQDSSVCIAMGCGAGWVESILDWGKRFSLLHSVQTVSVVHPGLYRMDTGRSFPVGKAAGA